ncbi:unnamed protein product [Mytilus coruscus]|uniref:B box-type domain-containing protein n=1 Tax=Mytilus coruscus TaxID=42192 RepID=A0A6J8D0E5_MYTCO|nr:unnamed protein product [Mytilus coruscus]
MATCTSVCAICDPQDQTTESTHWCIECEEPFCSDCKKTPQRFKGNKKSQNDSPIRLPIITSCFRTTVGTVANRETSSERVKDIKTSVSFVDLEQNLDDLFTNINLIHKDRESNRESITDRKKKINAEVCHLKMQVIQHFNKPEEEFIKELDQIESYCCDSIHSIVSSLQYKAKEIKQMKSEIQSTKKYASDLQAFLSIREIPAKTTEFKKHLQSSIENKNHDKINIESATNTKIHDILMIDKLCFIEIKKSRSTDINLNSRKERQAQMMIPKEVVIHVMINNVKLVFKRTVHQTCMYSTGCCVTNKCEFLFLNYEANNQQLIAINADGVVDYYIPLYEPYGAYDVACVGDSTVAVSTGYSHTKPGISFVDLMKRKIIKFIDLPDSPYGNTYDVVSPMSTSPSVCTVCDLRHQTSPSSHWCIECEEPLCSDCREYHNVLKATRNHKTIAISDYQSLQTVVTDIKQNCVYLYCIKDGNPICNKCIKGHGKFWELLSLEEVVRDIKTSESCVDLEQSIGDLFDNGEIIVTDHNDNYAKLLAINAEGEIEYTISLTEPNSAFDVTSLDEYKVAVSTGYPSEKPGISIVDLAERKIIKFIDLLDHSYGITDDGKSLICCVEDKDFHVISCTDSITTTPYTVLPEFIYVSEHDDMIFFTNPVKSKITCCSHSGTLMWEFKDKRVLVRPKGITVDNNGNS